MKYVDGAGFHDPGFSSNAFSHAVLPIISAGTNAALTPAREREAVPTVSLKTVVDLFLSAFLSILCDPAIFTPHLHRPSVFAGPELGT